MIGKSQSDKKPVSSAEALEVLESRKEEGELGYEQKLAYEHIKKFSAISAEEARKMAKELMEYGVGEATAIKIVDIMPIDAIQLKHILAREKKTFEEDEVAKMMEVVKSHKGR
jgi:DNA-directed RNA polymerase subunit F